MIVTPKAAVYHNSYQESEPVCSDDTNTACQEVGVMQVEGSKPTLQRAMCQIKQAMVVLDTMMCQIVPMVEGGGGLGVAELSSL